MRSSLVEVEVCLPSSAHISAPLPGHGFAGACGNAAERLAAAGYVEEEFLASTLAGVRKEVDGAVKCEGNKIPATTRILVRRPIDAARASGVVVLELFDAPFGYDTADIWEATAAHITERGHTWVGMTAGPVAADALRRANPERYAGVSWARDPGVAPETVVAKRPGDPVDVVLDGAEEGFVWDFLISLSRALHEGTVPGVRGDAVVAAGHGYAGIQLNTFANTVHNPCSAGLGYQVIDGYLNVAGGGIRRTLNQDSTEPGIAAWRPARPPRLEVPHITVSAEADHVLYGSALLAKRSDLGPLVRHVQVPGAPHHDVTAHQIPTPAEILAAGRCPRCDDEERSVVPLGTVAEGMLAALVRWVRDGVPAPESRWLTLNEAGSLKRDDLGNVAGGVRTGLADMPLASILGASAEHLGGKTTPVDRASFKERYGTREEFFTWFDIIESVCQREGYITEHGAAKHRIIAEELLDRIGV